MELFKLLFLIRLLFQLGSPLLFAQTPPPKSTILVLQQGQKKQIQVTPKANIFIEKRILKANLSGRTLSIYAQKIGKTSLSDGQTNWNVFVLSNKDYQTYQDFNEIFKDHPNLNLKPNKNTFVVQGEILSLKDLENILEWKKNFQHHLTWELQIPDHIKPTAKDYFSKKLQTNVSFQENKFNPLIFKSPPSKENQTFLKNLNLDHKIINLPSSPLGYIKLYFAEIKKSDLERLSPLVPPMHNLQELSARSLLNAAYEHLDDKIFTSVGSQTRLLLFEGQEAKVHSGGEFPILNKSFYGSEVTWKKYGLFIKILGQEMDQATTTLNIDFRLSMLNSTNDETPSLSSESWQQKIRIKKNTNYILKSGFTKHHMKQNSNSSLFKNIPLLKFLFRSHNYNKSNTEVVLVLKLQKPQGL